MAWQTINHTCGHSSEDQFYGPSREREARLAREERKECPACSKARWIKEHANDCPEAIVRRIPPGSKAPATYRVEIIVTKSWKIRDGLKERGYKFGEFCLSKDAFAGLAGISRFRMGMDEFRRTQVLTKGWGLILASDSPREDSCTRLIERFKAEIIWLGEAGCAIIEKINTDEFQQCAASLNEGRPDLA